MKVLLDTHIFLWWITEDPRLSSKASEIIRDGSNELFLSAASGWEIAIKAKLNRIQLPTTPEKFISEQLRINGIQGLPILMSHALHVYNLPNHHRDPFDRILIAQCQSEGLPILTADPSFTPYKIEAIWE
ncbi:MAG: type II toxin-antitoxin system VapC family toxin [Deltaproteobacteria bacterium]|nr:type II toxin-antitoxin system VapC family toxin [Deltaproteobacteria bacterium]